MVVPVSPRDRHRPGSAGDRSQAEPPRIQGGGARVVPHLAGANPQHIDRSARYGRTEDVASCPPSTLRLSRDGMAAIQTLPGFRASSAPSGP